MASQDSFSSCCTQQVQAPQPMEDGFLDPYIARRYDEPLTRTDKIMLSRVGSNYQHLRHEHRSFVTLQNEFSKSLQGTKPLKAQIVDYTDEHEIRERVAMFKACMKLYDEYHFFLPIQSDRWMVDILNVSLDAMRQEKLHPLVDPSLFLTQRGHYSLARISPALYLASETLKLPQTQDFIDALVFGSRTRGLTTGPRALRALERFWRRPKEISQKEQSNLDQVLRDVAATIDYKFMNLDKRAGTMLIDSKGGQTLASMVLQPDGSFALKNHIDLHENKYLSLGDLTGPKEIVLRELLSLADTILHELAHAINVYVAWTGDNNYVEPIFENNEPDEETMAEEVGYAFEKFVFGFPWPQALWSDECILKLFEVALLGK